MYRRIWHCRRPPPNCCRRRPIVAARRPYCRPCPCRIAKSAAAAAESPKSPNLQIAAQSQNPPTTPRSPTDHSCGSRNLFFTGRQRRVESAAGGKSIEYFCSCNESDGNSADTDSDSGDSDGCSGDSDDCSDDSDNCSNKTEEHSDWTECHKQWSFATNFTVYGCPTRQSALPTQRSNHPTRRSSHPNHRNRRPTRRNLDNSEVSHQNFTVIYHTHA